VLHGLTRPGVFARSEKAHGGKKAAVCVVENAGVFSRYIYPIRYVDASVFTRIRPRGTAAEHGPSYGTLGELAPAFDSLDRL
jgi:hypothetical protein